MPRMIPKAGSNKFRGWVIALLIAISAVVLRDLFLFLGVDGRDVWLATAASVALLAVMVHLADTALAQGRHDIPEAGFELRIADLCRRDGLLAVQVHADSHVKGYLPDGSLVLIQSGHTDHPARPLDLRHFIGRAHHEHQADIPVFVTEQGFTPEARRYAKHHGIVLIDHPRLTQWQQGHGLAAMVATGL